MTLEDLAESARNAVERLANTKMDLSLSEWCEISGVLLGAIAALEQMRADKEHSLAEMVRLDEEMGLYDDEPIAGYESAAREGKSSHE